MVRGWVRPSGLTFGGMGGWAGVPDICECIIYIYSIYIQRMYICKPITNLWKTHVFRHVPIIIILTLNIQTCIHFESSDMFSLGRHVQSLRTRYKSICVRNNLISFSTATICCTSTKQAGGKPVVVSYRLEVAPTTLGFSWNDL